MPLKKNIENHDSHVNHRYVYLAGSISVNEKHEGEIIDKAGFKNRLLTWAYLGGVSEQHVETYNYWVKRKKQDPEIQIFIDSGAYTFGNKITEFEDDLYDKKLEEYIAFIKENKEYIDHYMGLDHIWNLNKSLEYYEKMLEEGLDPVPVYHLGEPYEVLEYYAQESSYIAIALRGAKEIHQYATLQKIFSDFPNHKFHALAVNSLTKLFLDFPFYSCDSSSWTFRSWDGYIALPPGLSKYNKVMLALPPSVVSNQDEHSETIYGLNGEEKKKFFIRRQPRFIDLQKNEQDRIKQWLEEELEIPLHTLIGHSGTENSMENYENRGIAYLKALKIEMDNSLSKKINNVEAVQGYLFDPDSH